MSDEHDHFPDEDTARTKAREALTPRPIEESSGDWDRFVLMMRRAMPIGAVLLAAFTMGWPILNDTEVSFTLATDKVARSDDQILMENLVYVGTLNEDRVFRLEAAEGRQNSPNTPRLILSDIRARMDIEDGVEAHIEAGQGLFNTGTDILSVDEAVTLETNNGYSLSMMGADVRLKDQKAIGNGPVIGRTPLGRLDAGQVEILVKEAEGYFSGGVKLKIVPRRTDKR